MSRAHDRELERRVREAAPEPPPGLLEALLHDAPESLPARPVPAPAGAAGWRRRARSSWPVAASLVTLLAGGMFAWTIAHRAPPLDSVVANRPNTAQRPPGGGAADAVAASRRPQARDSGDGGGGAQQPQQPPAASGPTGRREPGSVPPSVGPVPSPAGGDRRPTAAAGGGVPRADPSKAPTAGESATPMASLLVDVTDPTGEAVPGATVTVAGAAAPAVRITDAEGRARFPALPVGRHRVEVHLEGFSRLALDVTTRKGEAHRLPIVLSAAVEDVITVTAESPLVDARISTGASVSRGELGKVPTARDPWVVRQRTPVVLADRISVGGTAAAPSSGSSPPPSTGGNAEPNDQPYGDVFYRGYGVHPFVDTEDDALSTFGLDVDSGSYNLVRRYLDDGHLPPPEAVRLEEMVNAFDYHEPAPRRGDFALRAEGAPSPWAPGERYYLLRLGIKARQVAAGERRPADLVFVVDVSGSMAREDRLGLVQESLHLLLGELTGADRVALVVYGSRGEVRLPFTTDRQAIAAAIERLVPDGSTNAEEGLVLAYELAAREGRRDAMRRIVLCSDGVANVGRTGPESLLARIGTAAREGIELTTVGFGMGNYNDVLMEQLANRGNGRYAYVDTLEEARRIFVENLTGTLQTVAAEARAQVAFEPRAVARWRLLGYENRDIADERFRDDTVDAGEIGAGHAVTALYEIKLQPGAERNSALLGTLRLRWRPAESEVSVESELPIRRGDLAPSWPAGSRAFRLATVVARFAEALRGSFWARGADLDRLAEEARVLARESSDEPRVAELARLVARAAELRRAETGAAASDEP